MEGLECAPREVARASPGPQPRKPHTTAGRLCREALLKPERAAGSSFALSTAELPTAQCGIVATTTLHMGVSGKQNIFPLVQLPGPTQLGAELPAEGQGRPLLRA